VGGEEAIARKVHQEMIRKQVSVSFRKDKGTREIASPKSGEGVREKKKNDGGPADMNTILKIFD